jgi:mRNA deadenylase 3'-5' endonuclease subunit Ccr4
MNQRISERILSHNLLAQNLASATVFNRIPARFLEQEQRFNAFKEEIRRFRPSLVCLQEASIHDPDVLAEAMGTLGFAGIQQQRPTPVPLAMFWQRATFDLRWSEERSRALICEFRDQNTSTNIFVVNCHLQARPDEVTSRTRVSQLHHALWRLELRLQGLSMRPQDACIFVCGDFNSLAEDAPYTFLLTGHLSASLEATQHQHVDEKGHPTDEIKHPFRFADVHDVFGRVPEFTHVRNGVGNRVDFVFAQNVGLKGALDVLPDGETWDERRETGLPSENQCSDHLPLICDFVL